MPFVRFVAPVALVFLAACAAGVANTDNGSSGLSNGDDDGGGSSQTGSDDSTGSGTTGGDDTSDVDGGGSTDDAGTGTPITDSSAPPFNIGTLFPPSQPSTPAQSVDGMSCANLGCFDVFDCAIFHPAESAACKFTKCDGLICK